MNKFFKLWFASGIFKLILAVILPLSADEAYYWVWSQNLQLSYFDHPGAIAWLLRLGQIFDFQSSARWPIVVIGHLTILVWYFILKDRMDQRRLLWLLSLFLFSPLVGFGSLIATPDVPVMLFWSLAVFFFMQALYHGKNIHYILLGACLGLGFCSKYHIVLIVPVFIIYLSLHKKWKTINGLSFVYMMMAGFVCSLPVLIWNYNNDFSSFKFQINHGVGRSHWDPYWTWSYILGMIVLCFPSFLWQAFKKTEDEFISLLKILSWFPLGFFLMTSFRGHVELNWPIIALPSLFAIAAMQSHKTTSIKIHNVLWGLVIGLFLLNHWFHFSNKIPDRLAEENYYRPLQTWVNKQQPTYVSTYQMASILWFLNKTPVYKLPQMSRIDYFDKINNPMPLAPFYLIREIDASLPEWISLQNFDIQDRQRINQDFELIYFNKK